MFFKPDFGDLGNLLVDSPWQTHMETVKPPDKNKHLWTRRQRGVHHADTTSFFTSPALATADTSVSQQSPLGSFGCTRKDTDVGDEGAMQSVTFKTP